MRGFAAWLSERASLLLFGATLLAGLLAFVSVQQNYALLDSLSRETVHAELTLQGACAAPLPFEARFPLRAGQLVVFSREGQSFLRILSGASAFERPLRCSVQNIAIAGPARVKVSANGTGIVRLEVV